MNGVREMCDVCDTTIFNYHWSCGKCGFAVCIDCYKIRQEGGARVWNKNTHDRDDFRWLLCTDDEPHEQDELMMTQIIVGNSLEVLQRSLCDQSLVPLHITSPTLPQSEMECLDLPHSFLHDGRLLYLMDPQHAGNLKAFQYHWSTGRPVLVSNVNKNLDMNLWQPHLFSKDFGNELVDLVDCRTGKCLRNQLMKQFWDGFDNFDIRIENVNGEPLLLKLKDWPSSEDFSEKLPTHFKDLMKALPLSDYTQRDGVFNLITYLPQFFLKPDLGPKMYTAYGSTSNAKGTSNLHLDMSDAVNLMVFVKRLKDESDREKYFKNIYRVIEEADCDVPTKKRVHEKPENVGALWHIYDPSDTNKIREFLEKAAKDRATKTKPYQDVIHDQTWYLNRKRRKQLFDDYGVKSYSIVQFLGDAIFIPAGALHQVLNLNDCIKVAEDFVSPENISECLKLTHEFRALSPTNEDKLQVKNILYHTVKDTLACL